MNVPPSAELVLVRHGQSEWNVQGRWQGQADPPLTAEGRAQATRAAAALAPLLPAGLYASDLRRAAETARILGRALGLEPALEPRLRELHVGEWSGRTHDNIRERWPDVLARFRQGDPDARPPGGETPRELRVRVDAALAEIAARHAGGRVVVVTHGGVVLRVVPGTRLANAAHLRVRATAVGWQPVAPDA